MEVRVKSPACATGLANEEQNDRTKTNLARQKPNKTGVSCMLRQLRKTCCTAFDPSLQPCSKAQGIGVYLHSSCSTLSLSQWHVNIVEFNTPLSLALSWVSRAQNVASPTKHPQGSQTKAFLRKSQTQAPTLKHRNSAHSTFHAQPGLQS